MDDRQQGGGRPLGEEDRRPMKAKENGVRKMVRWKKEVRVTRS